MDFQVETSISKQELWDTLETAMNDSTQSWLWPNQLSNVSGEGIKSNAEIIVNYKLSFAIQAYTYSLTRIKNLETFRYQAVAGKHPFKGGATISIQEDSTNNKRILSWKGSYKTKPFQYIQRLVFDRYQKRFFEQLEKNMRAQERK